MKYRLPRLAAILTLAVVAAAPNADAADLYRVAGTGDSILHLVRATGALTAPDRLIDTEQGRDPVTPGNQGRLSTTQAYAAALNRSEPGGYIVLQDNGANATEAQWALMLRNIVNTTPADRTIVAVLPAYNDDWSTVNAARAARLANIMVREIKLHERVIWIRWNQAVNANPALVYDGYHPTPLGCAWLAAHINAAVGWS